ncbi:IS110 family transposase [Nocardioides sp.]|uniref:IS110 family transposase n=1 Tax=Nocardioides sp. TaxID=35761 RepID=UPI002D7E86DB|nr:IS110 family transposase [Nocardioides sp.]HET8960713.1 IS110 family transposase [Nocardioides sp.]
MNQEASRVVIGMDPHKRSATIEVMTADETVLGGDRFATDSDGFAAMMRYVTHIQPVLEDRIWAIEGCNGIGHHVAMRLLAAGEEIVDVPPKLSARARVFATGQGRKTDATDAHSVALVGTRMSGLRPVVNDEQLAVLRVLVDRRRSLGDDHTRMISQLHHLLLELIPGGAKKDLSAAQAKALLAKVRPRDTAGKTRRRVAAELISDLERVYRRKKAADKELRELVAATGTTLLDLHGIGPTGAARLLVEVGDITRFPDRGHFASWNGTAPIDASSGDHVRHRLSRAGNRQINRILHTMATVQLRNPTEGRAYYDRKKAAGKSSMEAMRCLKRRLSDLVYRAMVDDALATTAAPRRTDPGGQRGDDSDSSAAGSHPHTDSSDKPLPGPATPQPRTPLLTAP